MDKTFEAVTFMAADGTNVCPVYGYKFPHFVQFMVTKAVFPCHVYRRPHSFSPHSDIPWNRTSFSQQIFTGLQLVCRSDILQEFPERHLIILTFCSVYLSQ